MKVPLSVWAQSQFDPVPSKRRLLGIVHRISPPPVKVGRTIMVEQSAVLLDEPVYAIPASASGRVADILRGG